MPSPPGPVAGRGHSQTSGARLECVAREDRMDTAAQQTPCGAMAGETPSRKVSDPA